MEKSFLTLLSDVAVESGNDNPVHISQRKRRSNTAGSETGTSEILGSKPEEENDGDYTENSGKDDDEEEEEEMEEIERTRSASKRRKRHKRKQFSFFRNDKNARAAGYMYRRLWVADIPMLANGEGLHMLKRLGLDEFYQQEIPELNKKWCDSFLSTFDTSTNSGRVGDRVITLDAESVARATKLPADGDNVHSSFGKSRLMQLGSFNDKTCRGFNLEHLADRDDFHLFQVVAGMLMIRLEARKECFQFASGEVIVALDKSLKTGVRMNWAEYMVSLMRKITISTSRKSPSSSIGYPYGEWLTRIIENGLNGGGLAEAGGAVRGQESQEDEENEEAEIQCIKPEDVPRDQTLLKQALVDARLRIFHLERKRDEALELATATLDYLKTERR